MRGRSIPVIGLSASAFEEDRKRVQDSGADDFIGKPIREPELWEKIEQLLNVEFVYAAETLPPDKSLEPSEKGTIAKENIADLPEDLTTSPNHFKPGKCWPVSRPTRRYEK